MQCCTWLRPSSRCESRAAVRSTRHQRHPPPAGRSAAGRALVVRLRSRLAAVAGNAQVGGDTAQNRDFVSSVYGHFPVMLGLIALVT